MRILLMQMAMMMMMMATARRRRRRMTTLMLKLEMLRRLWMPMNACLLRLCAMAASTMRQVRSILIGSCEGGVGGGEEKKQKPREDDRTEPLWKRHFLEDQTQILILILILIQIPIQIPNRRRRRRVRSDQIRSDQDQDHSKEGAAAAAACWRRCLGSIQKWKCTAKRARGGKEELAIYI
jgi:hypothetical protein